MFILKPLAKRAPRTIGRQNDVYVLDSGQTGESRYDQLDHRMLTEELNDNNTKLHSIDLIIVYTMGCEL